MARHLQRAAVGLAAAGILAGAAVLALPSSAFAASYNGVCGSSYGVIDGASLPGLGTVYLTFSGVTGENCVVTIRDNPGPRLPMNAYVRLSGTTQWNQDPGNFTTFAGPVYVSAAHHCIDWGGSIENEGFTELNSHCG